MGSPPETFDIEVILAAETVGFWRWSSHSYRSGGPVDFVSRPTTATKQVSATSLRRVWRENLAAVAQVNFFRYGT